MFIGHFAVALGAKRVAPRVSLGTLVLAAQLVDLLWPLFLLLGLEHVRIDPGNTAVTPLDFYDYPLTHSLLAAVLWSLAAAALYYSLRRTTRAAWIVGAVVLSHWVLDLVTHRPDLPLVPGLDARAGFGLWYSLPGTLMVEIALFALGVFLYAKTTRPLDRAGSIGFWMFTGVLAAIYLANLAGTPPSPGAIAVAGNASWVFVLWAYWIDRHRTSVPTISSL
jgi:hypothetical protein